MYRQKEKKKIGFDGIKNLVFSPVGKIGDGLDIDIKGDHDIYIDGCTGVAEFTDEKIVFLGKNMNVVVQGENFELYAYADGCLRAGGKIRFLEIVRGGFND